MTAPISTREKYLHRFFEVSLLVKAVDAAGEIAAAIFTVIVPPAFVRHLVQALTRGELVEDPHDIIANYLLHWAQHLSIGVQHFIALYLLIHGLIKLWLIAGLLRERLWYYPVALVVFGAFIVYQLYRYGHTHSIWLLAITGLDLVVIALTWHEFRYLQRLRRAAS